MDKIQNIADQQGWNDDTRLQLAESFIESSGQLEAYLEHLRQTAAEESAEEEDETDEETQSSLLCHLCAEPFIIEAGGTAHHVDEYGNIDHDLDAEHVPYSLEEAW